MSDYADLVGHWQAVAYVEAASTSTAALLFDFCITFDSEVRWTWGRKWGIMRIAFVISRYLPVGTVAIYLYYGSLFSDFTSWSSSLHETLMLHQQYTRSYLVTPDQPKVILCSSIAKCHNNI